MNEVSNARESFDRVIGLDVSDRKSAVCEVDGSSGEVACRYRIETTAPSLQRAFGDRRGLCIALEAGKQSAWISRLLARLGHRVLVANPRKLRLIYENERKSDRIDAEYLARLARFDPKLLHPLEHRSEGAQADLSLLRARDALVSSRTALVNHVRGAVKSHGASIGACSTEAFAKRAQESLPETLRAALLPVVETIETQTRQIRSYDRAIDRLIRERYPECELFRRIRGVGAITALAFRLVIDDPQRFRKSRSVGAYLGLTPGLAQSGASSPPQHVTKAGDAMMRRLLVQAAQYILGHFGKDCDLRRHGERIAAAGGPRAKRRGVIAVARKLAVLMHRLWIRGEIYQPLYLADSEAA